MSARNVPSVVLIDEIDKADIDFPNDLLLLLDRFQFKVEEIDEPYTIDALRGENYDDRRQFLPIVIITSNRETALPMPFLRRCLYYHIKFPKLEFSTWNLLSIAYNGFRTYGPILQRGQER